MLGLGLGLSLGASLVTADSGVVFFFKSLTVPHQTVTSSTFEVQALAEVLDPADVIDAPVLVGHDGTSYEMTAKQLTWPGTVTNSIIVFAYTITLNQNALNSLKIRLSGVEIDVPVTHKTSLSTQTATDATDLVAKVQAALTSSVDVIELGYDEADLGLALNDVGNNQSNTRTTWLTVKPGAGHTAGWNRVSGAATARPKCNLLHLESVVFGSDTSDGAGGQFYIEPAHYVWVSGCEFRGKYKYTWAKVTPMTSSYLADIRVVEAEAQHVYLTDSLFDGVAATVSTFAVELARDLRFTSHRGDFNNFGKVFLNCTGSDVFPVRNSADTDYLHNDGFQVWGPASEIVFKGLKITSPNVPADLQPFLFDRTNTPNYSKILLDVLNVEGAITALKAQLAGTIANARLSNLSVPENTITIRQDFVDTNGAFSPTNVVVSDLATKTVEYYGPLGNETFSSSSVANAADASPELNAKGMTGVTFSNIALTVPAGSGAPWELNAVELDGTNDWLHLESGFSGSGGKQLLIALNFYMPTTWPTAGTILSMATAGGTAQFTLGYASTGRVTVTVRDAANVVIGNFTAANSSFAVDTWYSLLIALDTNTGMGWQVYARPSGGSWAAVSASTATFTVDGITAGVGRCRFGAASSAGSTKVPQSYYGDVWASLAQTLDLSVAGNRDKFLPTEPKGDTGNVPTGVTPAVFLSGATATWHTNKGSGGGFTLAGALTTAPSLPA